MAPKSFMDVRPDGSGNIAILPNAIAERPELLPLIMRIIATWAEIEAMMASILGVVLNAHPQAAAAIFYTLNSTHYQFQIVREAAQAQLSEDDFELFEAVFSIIQGLHGERNKLVHWRYGVCHELPDALLLAPPSHNAEQHAKMVTSKFKKTTVTLDFDRKNAG